MRRNEWSKAGWMDGQAGMTRRRKEGRMGRKERTKEGRNEGRNEGKGRTE